MRFDLRYLWSTRFVAARLARGELSDVAAFRYFLAVMVFDWLQFTLIAVTPAVEVPLPARVHAWLTFVFTVLGLVVLHACNGGEAGRDFCKCYFALSVTVGWKFIAAMLAADALLGWAPWPAGWPQRAWLSVGSMALLNLGLFGRMGVVLSRLAHRSAVPGKAGIKEHTACYGTRAQAES
jgi:hypothetical protein